MKSKLFLKVLLLVLVIHLSVITLMNAQPGNTQTAPADLYKEIERMDSTVFGAFNTRDTNQFKAMFTEDLEFYHDKGGLTGYNHTMEFMRSTAKTGNGLKRELVKGSLEVYPIPGYGAMEIGSHTFCHKENNKQDCGTFKFVHIWQKKNGVWKITRVVSYDH